MLLAREASGTAAVFAEDSDIALGRELGPVLYSAGIVASRWRSPDTLLLSLLL